jgi:ribosomal protein S14
MHRLIFNYRRKFRRATTSCSRSGRISMGRRALGLSRRQLRRMLRIMSILTSLLLRSNLPHGMVWEREGQNGYKSEVIVFERCRGDE